MLHVYINFQQPTYFLISVIKCTAFPNLENGETTCTDDNNYGSTCTFQCEAGFDLIGSVDATCGGDASSTTGKWDQEQPVCAGMITPRK